MSGDLEMNANSILLGGSGATESVIKFDNNRIEFRFGGTVRFYIDTTGGHNA
jgi:hypothetical protein